MRVLVLQGGLTPYFRLLLERLSGMSDVQVALVIPQAGGVTLGSGVHTDDATASFPIFHLEEYLDWYGKAFFKGFDRVVSDFNPDVVLLGYPYIIQLVFNPSLLRRLRERNVKVVYRDIPWNIPPRGKAIAYFKSGRNRGEAQPSSENDGGWVALIKFLLLTEVRRRYLAIADAHLYYTDEARDLISGYGVASDKIFISANSPDTDVFLNVHQSLLSQASPPKLHPHRLIHVGRLVRWKRVDLILEAVSALSEGYPAIELVVAGYGPEDGNLRAQAQQLQISDRVVFLGGVYEPSALGDQLMQAGIYVLAGMGGLSINDAMCFAKPVICSEADGTERRLVRDGENGFYFENGNSHDLANKIKIIFDDLTLMERFGRKSIEIIEKEVNIHTVVREYLRAFNFAVTQ